MLQPFSTAELIQEFCSYFKDLDSPKDDLVIVMIDSDKDMDDEVHATENVETGDTSVPKSLFPRSSQVQELTNQVVNKYYNDKLQYDRYCDKMLNRRAVSKITNCDVLTKKGPITLKVYREDGTSEIIPNFKASDLHLGEWREVMKACPNRTGKGWETIYKQIGLDDHASSLLLAEIDKRNLNPLKQMRVIEQLRQ
ncbi:hypothetical protein Tco_0578774 [Tanacetum coccineum]